MSDQDNGQVSTLQRPTTDDPKAWRAYWKAQNQSWRIEPEIDIGRQQELAKCLSIISEEREKEEDEILFFKDIQLNRADMEWLLATHKKMDRIINIKYPTERRQKFESLNLSGADLRNVDLTGLSMERVNLTRAHLEGTNMIGTHLEEALLIGAHLEGAHLVGVHLEGAYLGKAHLEGVEILKAHLENASLDDTHLEGANLFMSRLENASLRYTHLEGANLFGAHLEGAFLIETHLAGANLCETFFNSATQLVNITLANKNLGVASLADVRWSDTNLAVVDWSSVKKLGDEIKAKLFKKDKAESMRHYRKAVRANRQLAVALQAQGLNEDAARFAYRAQKLQRVVLRRQKKFGRYLFSLLLDLLAGYGYHPLRTLFWYILTVCTFALAYHYVWTTYNLEKITHHPLSYVGAFVFSITAFHGRGFFLGGDFGYDSLITILAAIEAVIGLIIEFSFIATFTQRFFGS